MARAADIYYKISPISLAGILVLNFLLIYMNLISLENQSAILSEIKYNTEVGLNVSEQNQVLLNKVIQIQKQGSETFNKVIESAANKSNT